MENTTATQILETAIKAANGRTCDRADAAQLANILPHLQEMDRDTYLAVRALWRSRYAELSALSRQTKRSRKDDRGLSQSRVHAIKWDARRFMAVRFALRVAARARAAAAVAAVAA